MTFGLQTFCNKTPSQIAASLRHIRGKEIDKAEYKLVEEIDQLSHEDHLGLEQSRMTRCIAYLKGVLDQVAIQLVPESVVVCPPKPNVR